MSQDSAVDASLALVGAAHLRATEEQRERYLKRLGAAVAVALVHVLMIAILVVSGRIGPIAPRQAYKELLLLLPSIQKAEQPKPAFPQPEVQPLVRPPAFTITAPPPPPTAEKPGDVMQAIGREIACGAGSYENLTQAQREQCKRQPWKFKKTPKGVIVLDVTPQQKPDESISGADETLHMLRTNDPCLAEGNTHSECIHKTIFGH